MSHLYIFAAQCRRSNIFQTENVVRSNNLSLISKVSAFQSEDLGFATNSKVPIPIPLHSDDVNFRYFKLKL